MERLHSHKGSGAEIGEPSQKLDCSIIFKDSYKISGLWFALFLKLRLDIFSCPAIMSHPRKGCDHPRPPASSTPRGTWPQISQNSLEFLASVFSSAEDQWRTLPAGKALENTCCFVSAWAERKPPKSIPTEQRWQRYKSKSHLGSIHKTSLNYLFL